MAARIYPHEVHSPSIYANHRRARLRAAAARLTSIPPDAAQRTLLSVVLVPRLRGKPCESGSLLKVQADPDAGSVCKLDPATVELSQDLLKVGALGYSLVRLKASHRLGRDARGLS